MAENLLVLWCVMDVSGGGGALIIRKAVKPMKTQLKVQNLLHICQADSGPKCFV